MLAQQLRALEADGIVIRRVYQQVPPKVEYRMSDWGQALCPALDALLKWAEVRDSFPAAQSPEYLPGEPS
ncbi:HxlR-like helix-turn-helix [compost metagenome]